MGLSKYFEDNYEMFLERIEDRNNENHIYMEAKLSLNITPVIRTVEPKSQLVRINQKIKCKECGEFFELTYGEQKFYKKHNLCNPKRCKSCRDLRKAKAS